MIPASVAARPGHVCSTQHCSTAPGEICRARGNVLAAEQDPGQSEASTRPRDELSTNQGPAWAGSWSLVSLFPRAELRLVTSPASQQPFAARRSTIQYLHLNIHTCRYNQGSHVDIILTVISTDYIFSIPRDQQQTAD